MSKNEIFSGCIKMYQMGGIIQDKFQEGIIEEIHDCVDEHSIITYNFDTSIW